MKLPSVLEIVPPKAPPRGEVTIPGSKSITNRALVLAALMKSGGVGSALWSEDTEVMVECLSRLISRITVMPDREPENRLIGMEGGVIGAAPPMTDPVDLYVGNSGTTARFVAALACLGRGRYRVHGTPRMHERPQAPLFAALRQLGYRIDTPNDMLPAIVHGDGPRPGATCRIRADESSQFASALLLAAPHGGWEVTLEGANAEDDPYIKMTSALVEQAKAHGWDYHIFPVEPDASSASYFWGAKWLLRASDLRIADWPAESLQIDAQFPRLLETFPPVISRRTDLGDSIMTAIVLAPFASAAKTFVDLGRLRVQECERVQALRVELTKCGARIVETGDTLRVEPGPLHGAEIETYNDHRMAMCFAMLGLAVPGMRIRNPECVKKTFPGFFDKLAGLGVTLLPVS
jgi:3-phosphoshikimate 1-carboxyvinyltransferase